MGHGIGFVHYIHPFAAAAAVDGSESDHDVADGAVNRSAVCLFHDIDDLFPWDLCDDTFLLYLGVVRI